MHFLLISKFSSIKVEYLFRFERITRGKRIKHTFSMTSLFWKPALFCHPSFGRDAHIHIAIIFSFGYRDILF